MQLQQELPVSRLQLSGDTAPCSAPKMQQVSVDRGQSTQQTGSAAILERLCIQGNPAPTRDSTGCMCVPEAFLECGVTLPERTCITCPHAMTCCIIIVFPRLSCFCDSQNRHWNPICCPALVMLNTLARHSVNILWFNSYKLKMLHWNFLCSMKLSYNPKSLMKSF